MSKYACPPQTGSGQGTFSDNLVGLQLTQGGGLTQGNFIFTNTITEKVNRSFQTGTYSNPINLDNLNISSLAQAEQISKVNFKIYPNFDETVVTNYVAYGPLTKRLSAAVLNIINYFPAALEITAIRPNYSSGVTAQNIYYDSLEDITYFSINTDSIKNPFSIDYTTQSTLNLSNLGFEVSKYRNLPNYFNSYIVQVTGSSFSIADLTASTSTTADNLYFSAFGNLFGDSVTEVYETIIIRPNDFTVNEVFNLDLDEVEELLLNRYSVPQYTSQYKVLSEGEDGTEFFNTIYATWPKDGQWNIDIRTPSFIKYLEKLDNVGQRFDETETNLISRYYTTDSFKEFDTIDQKVDKTLKIYGRSFDETKKYVDSISHMVSVNYTIKDDVPSGLLTNFAETLGWKTNISPIQSDSFLGTLYTSYSSQFNGMSTSLPLEELQNQYYRNLILNSGYLFRSKGTRRAVEFLMNNIGAPEALLEFNENVYLVDGKFSIDRFNELFFTVTGGTYTPDVPVYDPNNVYRFNGAPYTAYTPSTDIQDVPLIRDDYPVDDNGYPTNASFNSDFYFQKGSGWFESTPQHRSPEILDTVNSTFTGQNFNIQTALEPFTYGEKYFERFRNFPFLNTGYELLRTIDNKKSWARSIDDLRKNSDGNYDAYYIVPDDRLVMNVKNVDLFLNPAQALAYDVWYMSLNKSYPIPLTGLSDPYPTTGNTDWTVINPKPQQKDFFEFYQTFWTNMINVRNRQMAYDGKTSGYPTLQSIFWRYLTSFNDVGIENDNFSYTTMIKYIEGIGDFWVRLVEQFIPATTIWNTGTKYENSIFHRQKFVYRPQRGCIQVNLDISGPQVVGGLAPNICNTIDIFLNLQYNSNNIQEGINQIPLQGSCPSGLPSVVSLRYGFDLIIVKNNQTITLTYSDPQTYNSPNLVINGNQWDTFILQGIGFLTDEINALAISATYEPTTNNLILESQDCDDIQLVDFELKFINVIYGC
jgi:hypothetical protein